MIPVVLLSAWSALRRSPFGPGHCGITTCPGYRNNPISFGQGAPIKDVPILYKIDFQARFAEVFEPLTQSGEARVRKTPDPK
jgi:hypothetical protein